jgi:hypothetical protein
MAVIADFNDQIAPKLAIGCLSPQQRYGLPIAPKEKVSGKKESEDGAISGVQVPRRQKRRRRRIDWKKRSSGAHIQRRSKKTRHARSDSSTISIGG